MRQKAIKIVQTLLKHGYEAYFVGGCVRDFYLGKEIKDYDVTTNATPEQVAEVFGETVTCGNNFLVSLVDGIEVATYRRDKAECAVHADTLEEDVLRRDFTINGLAVDIESNIIDHVGGIKDIQDRILRFIGDPYKRIVEDPVRILRGLRFMAKFNLTPDYETHYAMLKYRQLLYTIPKERIKDEVVKAFACNAYGFVKLLDEYELLNYVFPALYAVKGIDGGVHHKETVYTHCLNALKAIDLPHIPVYVKLSALYHDVGKANYRLNEDGNPVFYSHEEHSRILAEEDMYNLCFPKDTVKSISLLCLVHMYPILDTTDSTQRKVHSKRVKKLLVILEDMKLSIRDFIRVRYADKKANMQHVKVNFSYYQSLYHQILRIINTKPPFSVKDLAVNGYDMIEIGLEGKEIGFALNALLDKVVSEEIPNEYEPLMDYALTFTAKENYET